MADAAAMVIVHEADETIGLSYALDELPASEVEDGFEDVFDDLLRKNAELYRRLAR